MKEECAFFGAQNTRAATIEMAEKPVAEDDGAPARSSESTPGTSRSAVPPLEHPQCKGGRMGPPGGHDACSRHPGCSSGRRAGGYHPGPPCSMPAVLNASHAAHGTACHGVRSHPVPVA